MHVLAQPPDSPGRPSFQVCNSVGVTIEADVPSLAACFSLCPAFLDALPLAAQDEACRWLGAPTAQAGSARSAAQASRSAAEAELGQPPHSRHARAKAGAACAAPLSAAHRCAVPLPLAGTKPHPRWLHIRAHFQNKARRSACIEAQP